jgi:16S rRNA (cytidine1402-2'-O)-methyltransferase
MRGQLFLLPNSLGGNSPEDVIPGNVIGKIKELNHFIVENERNARRWIIKCGYEKSIDEIRFFVLNKHTPKSELHDFIKPCLNGLDVGVISEAGVPGIADPGAEIVAIAHKNNIPVKPLTGPSSILLALMASGLNGQSFSFHGYLPVQSNDRKNSLKKLESEAKKTGTTQIFIETPYRNDAMLDSIKKTCQSATLLCIACDITMESEYIKTMNIGRWKKERVDLKKRPCIFLLQ